MVRSNLPNKILITGATGFIGSHLTELMVEKIVKIFKKKDIFILDIGTGTGCILLSILSELKNSKGIGVDISSQAIQIASANSKKHQLTQRTKFYKRSLNEIYHNKFDLIVSNPPYIMRKDIKNLNEDIKKFEPKLALDGGNDGLDVIKKVIYKSRSILKIKGMLALEIGNEQFKKVSKILILNTKIIFVALLIGITLLFGEFRLLKIKIPIFVNTINISCHGLEKISIFLKKFDFSV